MELLIADTAGIQPYIFGSNRLRENIGASFLVDQATGDWAREALMQVCAGHCNVRQDGSLDPDWHLEAAGHKDGAEVIYSGGGNLLALFDSTGAAERFARALSLRALTEAPGLDLVIQRRPLTWDREPLAESLESLLRELARHKQSRPRLAPLAGLGVTQTCPSTGLPVVGKIDVAGKPRAVSAEILAKLIASRPAPRGGRSPAEERLYAMADSGAGFAFPRDLAELGGTPGEQSYMAVVHADGNGMGQRLQEAAKDRQGTRAEIEALRAFSQGVSSAGKEALKAMVTTLVNAIEFVDGTPVIRHPCLSGLEVRLARDNETEGWFLPLRPLVFGGDDLTFVADGRLGLELATAFLDAFAHETAELSGGGASASAGIAIVKSSRPFAGAYALAEELCGSAKHYRREKTIHGGCLDWHFSSTATGAPLEVLRAREYGVRFNGGEYSLLLRPVALEAAPTARVGGTWPTVCTGIAAFQNPNWIDRRNKTKALREALRGGPDAVEWFRNKYLDGKTLPALPAGLEQCPGQGWQGDRCGYFDAVEIFDRFIPLRPMTDMGGHD
jgi:hypothetical protein